MLVLNFLNLGIKGLLILGFVSYPFVLLLLNEVFLLLCHLSLLLLALQQQLGVLGVDGLDLLLLLLPLVIGLVLEA